VLVLIALHLLMNTATETFDAVTTAVAYPTQRAEYKL
jgi:hypothetical protein